MDQVNYWGYAPLARIARRLDGHVWQVRGVTPSVEGTDPVAGAKNSADKKSESQLRK